MRGGQYNDYISVEQRTISTGPTGQPTTGVWTVWRAAVPVGIKALSGRKAEIARQLVAGATHEISLRYLSGLTPKMRFNLDGRIFNIGWIDELDFRRKYMRATVTEQETGS